MNILVIEDERSLADALSELLRQAGYAVDSVHDGEAGEAYAQSGIYDLIILDIMLPGKDGLSVLSAIRRRKLSTPVLLLTAKSEVTDKIRGLDTGADDYLTKPFATGELMARVRAMTRRKGDYIGEEIAVGDTVLKKDTHELFAPGGSVKLGMKEYQVMELMMQNSRQIIPKERFMERIWGFDAQAEYNAMEVYVSFLRKKLRAIDAGIAIKAVRGVGYALERPGDAPHD